MDNVIFLDVKVPARPANSLAPGHTAEIFIFQGVRVERLTDDMIAQTRSHLRRLPARQNNATAEELDQPEL